MIMKVFQVRTFLLLLALIFSFSCSPEQGWQESLEATAPEDPSTLARVNNSEPEAEEKPEKNPDRKPPVENRKTPAESQNLIKPEVRDGTFTIKVAGLSECRFGAVRCYLDRKYVGALNDDGTFSVAVKAGVYQGELMDSSGRWSFAVEIISGQVSEILLSCSDKTPFVESQLVDSEEETDPGA
jgi:hypothetical protein